MAEVADTDMTPEGKVKQEVKKILLEFGAYYAMPVGGAFGKGGIPDFLVCYKGRFIGIECKANGGQPTKLQLKNLDKITSAGGVSLVIDETNTHQLRDYILKS